MRNIVTNKKKRKAEINFFIGYQFYPHLFNIVFIALQIRIILLFSDNETSFKQTKTQPNKDRPKFFLSPNTK